MHMKIILSIDDLRKDLVMFHGFHGNVTFTPSLSDKNRSNSGGCARNHQKSLPISAGFFYGFPMEPLRSPSSPATIRNRFSSSESCRVASLSLRRKSWRRKIRESSVSEIFLWKITEDMEVITLNGGEKKLGKSTELKIKVIENSLVLGRYVRFAHVKTFAALWSFRIASRFNLDSDASEAILVPQLRVGKCCIMVK